MSAEVEKPTKKGPVRYFGDGGGESKPKVKSDPDGFDGEVIQVDQKPRFHGKRQFNNNRGDRFDKRPNRFNRGGQFDGPTQQKNQKVQLTIDPYALERHRRKSTNEVILIEHFSH